MSVIVENVSRMNNIYKSAMQFVKFMFIIYVFGYVYVYSFNVLVSECFNTFYCSLAYVR